MNLIRPASTSAPVRQPALLGGERRTIIRAPQAAGCFGGWGVRI